MQACLENTALPLLESASLPLIDAAPAWTIRVARPAAADRNELAQELRGVPKAALRQVFGKPLGTRLWQQNRSAAAITKPQDVATATSAPTPDAEISAALLRYSNGETETIREPLPQPANTAVALEAAARSALRGARSDAFVSLKLDLTAAASLA